MSLNDLFKTVVLLMYGSTCILCRPKKRDATTVHHIWPKGMGFTDLNTKFNPLNGCPVCSECHDLIHSVWGETTGREKILDKVPLLRERNHKNTPLEGQTERQVRKELNEMRERFEHLLRKV
jgi:hypothetical protein